MIKYLLASLLFGAFGYFCVIGADGSNGWVQLMSIVTLSAIGGLTFWLVQPDNQSILTLYGVAFSFGALASVFVGMAHGGA